MSLIPEQEVPFHGSLWQEIVPAADRREITCQKAFFEEEFA
jgi:hypothetical protein